MTKSFRTLDDVDVKGERVLLRVDLNGPMENGRVSDATRLERVAPTITEISDKGGKVVLLAHFGRPKGRDAKDSLKPVAAALGQVIKKPVAFAEDCIGEAAAKAIAAMKDGDILCLENTRFHKEEEKNDPAFVAELAKLGDIWVNDAFSAAHRAHASTEGLGHKLPAYAGRTMQADGMILDVGPQSIARIHSAIDDAATLVWNGPLGAFEMTPFDRGTVVAARHAAARTKAKKLISVAGGGDTVAALNQAGVGGDFSYVSTAGGAFLEWMEGKPLPGVEVLKTR